MSAPAASPASAPAANAAQIKALEHALEIGALSPNLFEEAKRELLSRDGGAA